MSINDVITYFKKWGNKFSFVLAVEEVDYFLYVKLFTIIVNLIHRLFYSLYKYFRKQMFIFGRSESLSKRYSYIQTNSYLFWCFQIYNSFDIPISKSRDWNQSPCHQIYSYYDSNLANGKVFAGEKNLLILALYSHWQYGNFSGCGRFRINLLFPFFIVDVKLNCKVCHIRRPMEWNLQFQGLFLYMLCV